MLYLNSVLLLSVALQVAPLCVCKMLLISPKFFAFLHFEELKCYTTGSFVLTTLLHYVPLDKEPPWVLHANIITLIYSGMFRVAK